LQQQSVSPEDTSRFNEFHANHPQVSMPGVTWLTSQMEFVREGIRMKHCIASFFMTGYHFGHISTQEGETSFAIRSQEVLRRNADRIQTAWGVHQHYAACNQPPPEANQKVLEALLEELNKN
jgi:hypothetical protein